MASVGVEIFTADINEHVGEARHKREHPEVNLDVPSSSTTPPRDGSPARTSTNEPICVEEEPASTGAGSHATATDVARGEENTPQ